MNRDKLYGVVGIVCLAGFLWLAVSEFFPQASGFGICLFKHITGIPCPSCGVTRAVTLLFHGKVLQSLAMNPLGIVMSPLLLIIPVWIFSDVIQHKHTFFRFYKKSETIIRRPVIATVLIALVIANWFWGISKGL